MGLNCDAHFGVNTAQERDVSTFPPGGGMRIEEEHNMRLQCG